MTNLAYLDASSGSMLLQALAGGLAGLAVVLRIWGAKVKRVLLFWRKPDPVAAPVDDAAAREPIDRGA